MTTPGITNACSPPLRRAPHLSSGPHLSSTAPRQCAPRNCAPRTSRSANRAAQLPPRNSRCASRADTPRQFFHVQPVVPLLLTPRPCRVAFFCSELRAPHRGTSLGPFVCGARTCSLYSFTCLNAPRMEWVHGVALVLARPKIQSLHWRVQFFQ